MNTPVADLRSLRAHLVESAAAAPTDLAAMYGRMIAVMDNWVPTKGGRRNLAFRPKQVRQLQRHVSLTIDSLYGIRNTPTSFRGMR